MSAATVYLAGPHMADLYRDEATRLLRPWDIDILDPMRPERDFRGREFGPEVANDIVRGDLVDIAQSDAVLACWTEPAVGTSMECWYAYSIGVPIYGYLGAARLSPWYQYIAKDTYATLRATIQSMTLDILTDAEWKDGVTLPH